MQKIINAFKKIGANAVINLLKPGPVSRKRREFRISIREDRQKHASCFVLDVRDETQVHVPDVSVKDHALLLKVHWTNEQGRIIREDFLCGRDDHGWFVSTLKSNSSHSVEEAFESLRPEEITRELREKKVPRSRQNKHRNEVFVRQGEWFFVPMPPGFEPKGAVREKERLGVRGKPHIADFVYSEGVVRYTHKRFLNLFTREEVAQFEKEGEVGFRPVFIVQEAFAKGRVVHPDHRTVFLDGWHRVVPNTENRLPGSNTFFD
ncbi:MAG: hypothetical protein IJQ31_05410 [Thermoguttaceae bacterium]|nr:hypothetical protein [Thermoguttaceae bacterium]